MSQSPYHEAKCLAEFLSDRDAPCPSCGYNLRNLTAPNCPECGCALVLGLLPAPKHREISVILAALWLAFGLGLFCWFATIVCLRETGRLPFFWGEPEATRLLRGAMLYLMTAVVAAPIAQWRWRSLLQLTASRRRAIAWLIGSLTGISLATVMVLLVVMSP